MRLAVLLCFALAPYPLIAGTRALLMGVQNYDDPTMNLEGVHNDIALIRRYLESHYADATIEVVLDHQATHRGIVEALQRLQNTEANDTVFIYWSGHGSQTKDRNGDEQSDGRDETWVTYGARRGAPGIDDFDVLDEELDHYLALIPTNKLIVVSDSCHSGSFSRAELSRALSADKREHPLGRSFSPESKPKGVRLGAASQQERAIEIRSPENKPQGAFTWHLVQALEQARVFDTWNDLLDRARATMAFAGIRQRPTLEGQGTLTRDFQPATTRFLRAVLGERGEDGRWLIKTGKLLGIDRGCRFRIDREGEPSQLEVVEAGFFQSLVELRAGPTPHAGDVAALTLLRAPVKIPVAIESLAPASASSLQSSIEQRFPDNFTWVEVGAARWLFSLAHDDSGAGEVRFRERETAAPARRLCAWPLEPDQDSLGMTLNALLRRDALLHLESRGKDLACTPILLKQGASEIADGMVLEHPELGQFGQFQPAEPTTLPNHSVFIPKLTNLARQQRYVYVISLDNTGHVGLIFPDPGLQAEEALLSLQQTKTFEQAAILFKNPGREQVLLISSVRPLDAEALIDPYANERGAGDRDANGGRLEDWDALILSYEIMP